LAFIFTDSGMVLEGTNVPRPPKQCGFASCETKRRQHISSEEVILQQNSVKRLEWFRVLFLMPIWFAVPAHIAAEDPASAATDLPAAASRDVDFHREVLPILVRHCVLCHSQDRSEGGFQLATRELLLKGGDSGPAVISGQSNQSLLVRMVAGIEQDRLMPAKGRRLTTEEVGLLRRWIDQGLPWEEGMVLSARQGLASLEPRRPDPPATLTNAPNPIDQFLQPYFERHGIETGLPTSDRVFARRVSLDLTGLLLTPDQLAAFETDSRPDKRERLVQQLLDDRLNYALHWMTFWNDSLRNSYRGTGFIDNGREQITGWLFAALYENKPYDQFVRELILPAPEAVGFTKGIRWRGVVNASQIPEMQAAQTISQVFLGTNLKCASCHDSFVDSWKLSDSYAMAAIFSDAPLEIHRCDKPTGEIASPGFLFPQLGSINASTPVPERRRELAEQVTAAANGRFCRTIVNRLWERLFGQSIIAQLDNVDEEPFDSDLLDWLASDFADHGYDLKRTLELICTSQVYQLQALPFTATSRDDPFRGPLRRRMTAEQFVDAVSQLTGVWPAEAPAMIARDHRGQGGQLAAVRGVLERSQVDGTSETLRRAVMVDADALQVALGRPNREQVVTWRESLATPLQALELTNGKILDDLLREGASRWFARSLPPSQLVDAIFLTALGRKPLPAESEVALNVIGSPVSIEGVQDLLWTITMLPEFQLID